MVFNVSLSSISVKTLTLGGRCIQYISHEDRGLNECDFIQEICDPGGENMCASDNYALVLFKCK